MMDLNPTMILMTLIHLFNQRHFDINLTLSLLKATNFCKTNTMTTNTNTNTKLNGNDFNNKVLISEHRFIILEYFQPYKYMSLQELPDGFFDLMTLDSSAKERLYMNRKKLERGLQSFEFIRERVLFNLTKAYLPRSNPPDNLIKNLQGSNGEDFSDVVNKLLKKYHKLTFTVPSISDNQPLNSNTNIVSTAEPLSYVDILTIALKSNKANLLVNNLKNKPLYGMMMPAVDQGKLDMYSSSAWLTTGNIKVKDECAYLLLKDKNMFWHNDEVYKLCPNKTRQTVEHMGTRCDSLRKSD
ncbi:MAG: hypothetical protein MHPSP_002089 [Paramarteilia canceri]